MTKGNSNWFPKLCRQAGLGLRKLVRSDDTQKKELSRSTEEKKVNDKVTLRRTTIEEIEIKKDEE